MGKIVYGVCGEGLGHATRAMTIVNELRFQHEFLIFAARDSYRYLRKHLAGSNAIRIEPIPGLNFRYLFQRISYILSIASSLPYVMKMGRRVAEMEEKLNGFTPDLVITDFEPLTARLARRTGTPLVSLDHQHFIPELSLNDLPLTWQLRARLMSFFVNRHYDWQDRTIISSFFNECFESTEQVEHVGVSLRPGLRMQETSNGDTLVVYLRKFHPRKLLEILGTRPRRCLIYGHHDASIEGNLEFKPVDNLSFCRDLATCRALICNAGNQLVGEAMSMGKPVMAFPETGNFEQRLNGYFLNQMGCGVSLPYNRLTENRFAQFMDSLDDYRSRIDRKAVVGNDKIISKLNAIIDPDVPSVPPQTVLVSA